MRKLFLLMAIVLTVSSVQSADLLETFENYRHLIRMELGVDTADIEYLTDTNANQFTRIAAVTLVPAILSNKAVFYNTTVHKKQAYSLDSSIISILGVQWIFEDSTKTLNFAPMEQWNLPISNQASDGNPNIPSTRRPFMYDYIEGTLFVNPIPIIGGDSLRIIAVRKVPSIAAIDSLSIIPQQYRVPVLHYAAWLAARSKQHPLTADFKQSWIESMAIVNQSLNKRGASVSPSD